MGRGTPTAGIVGTTQSPADGRTPRWHTRPMTDALLLLPDFMLILVGWAICRWTPLNRSVWDGAERLVYYVLFPTLLFSAILRNPLDLASSAALAGSGVAVTLVGIGLAFALRAWPGIDARLHASGAQTAFRFNSYVALALAERIAGTAGLAWIALIVALCVPLCNVAAVWSLARHGGHGTLRELARNPLIIATIAGLACNLLGLKLPDFALTTLGRIGGAALPIGLMAVGAGLTLGALRESPGLAAALLSIRHLVLPAFAIVLVIALQMPPAQQAVVVAFAALPTASSSYVLATRMGGHGGFVAGLVTVSTLIGMASLPLALIVLRALG
jgi:malonate transporter and related proteins